MYSSALRVIIEPSAALFPQPPGQHHALQQRRRREPRLAILLEHDVRDVIRRVEPDVIKQRERSHRIAGAELHALVDVLERTEARLVLANRVEEIRDEQPVDDEPWTIGRSDGLL